MRFLLLPILFILSAGCFAQSLKDSLFGGKLKVDSALLIKSKGNPQYSKEDSIERAKQITESKTEAASAKKTTPEAKQKTQPAPVSKTAPVTKTAAASKTVPAAAKKSNPDSLEKTESVTPNVSQSDSVQNNADKPELKYADNPKIWKRFIDQYTKIINTEVLPSKKIKRDTYTIMLDYEIGTDGVVSTKSISCMPENGYLVEQINERMMPNAPQLAPLIRNGVPVKSTKRQMIVFTKEKN